VNYRAPILARIILSRLRANRNLKGDEIQEQLDRYVHAKISLSTAFKVKAEATKLLHGTVADAASKLTSFVEALKNQGHYCDIFWVTAAEAIKAINRAYADRKKKHEEEESQKPIDERQEWPYPEPDVSGIKSTDRYDFVHRMKYIYATLS